jgi:hypothetical protein
MNQQMADEVDSLLAEIKMVGTAHPTIARYQRMRGFQDYSQNHIDKWAQYINSGKAGREAIIKNHLPVGN